MYIHIYIYTYTHTFIYLYIFECAYKCVYICSGLVCARALCDMTHYYVLCHTWYTGVQTHQWAMSHINESCHTCSIDMQTIWRCSHSKGYWMSLQINRSYANQWVVSHGIPRYASTPMSPNTHQWAMSHFSEACHTYYRDVQTTRRGARRDTQSYIRMQIKWSGSHLTPYETMMHVYKNQWVMSHMIHRYANTSTSHGTHQWVMSHINESCHTFT